MRQIDYKKSEQKNNQRTGNIFDPISPKLDQHVFDGITPRKRVIDFTLRLYYRAIEKELGVSKGQDLADLYLTGSLTTFQYDKSSDMDVSVFPHYEKIWKELGLDPDEARKRMVSLSIKHLDGTFVPGTEHPLQFFVVPSGTHPDDLYKPGLRSAYSLDDLHWFVEPEKSRSHDIEKELPEMYSRAANMASKMRDMLDHNPAQAKELWKQIHRKRQLDQQAGLGDYCLAPGTRVLRADYEWINIEDVRIGDVLVGFDKEVQGGRRRGMQRTFQKAIVRSTTPGRLRSYRVTTNNGEVVASAEHSWLVRNKKRMLEWRETQNLKPGDVILRFSEVWEQPSDPVKAAYLAGIFDGEGHMTKSGRLSFSQKEGEVRAQAQQYLHDLGFSFCSHRRQDDRYDWAWNMQVYGSVCDTMRFLFQIPTVRVGRDKPDWWVGRSITSKNRYANNEQSIVLEVEEIGEADVIGLGTSTGTLIAEGMLTSNSEGNIVYKWLLHEGLFDRIRHELGEYIARTAASWYDEPAKVYPEPTGTWTPQIPQEILDRYESIAECPQCHTQMLRDQNNTLYCPVCGYVFPKASKTATLWKPLDPKRFKEIGAFGYMPDKGLFVGRYHFDAIRAFELVSGGGTINRDQLAQEGEAGNNLCLGWIYEDRTTGNIKVEFQSDLLPEVHTTSLEGEAMQAIQNEYAGRNVSLAEPGDYLRPLGKQSAMQVFYDYEKDQIILGASDDTPPSATDLAASKIVGSYDENDKSITLYEAERQWVNPNYFRRLWNYSYPKRPLDHVHYQSGEDKKHIPTRHHPLDK